MGKIIIARRTKSASAGALEALEQAFEDGKNNLKDLCEDAPELGGKIYGLTYTITQSQSGLSPQDFSTACDKLTSMDPEQLARVVGLSKSEIGDMVCEQYGIGIDDKDFSGGADLIGDTLQIDLYFMGSAQRTSMRRNKLNRAMRRRNKLNKQAASEDQLQALISKCANTLEDRVADYESDYDGEGDPWDDDSFYDTIADVMHTMDLDFINGVIKLLKPDANANEVDEIIEDAEDYLLENTQNQYDRDYDERYEILLTGMKQILSNKQ